MWKAVGGLVCAALLASPCAPARAASNGMLAAVLHGTGDRVVTLNPDGTGARAVWTPPRGDALSEPVWAPDGNRLALVDADAAHGARIVVVDVASGQARAVTDHVAGNDDRHPGWTPDGTRIAFLRSLQNGVVRAASVNADGTDLQALLFSVPALGDADWSPDGGSLAYTSPLGLVIARLNLGATLTLLATAPTGVAWAPGGDAIAYQDVAGGNLRIVPLTGGAFDVTTPSDAPDTAPAWSPEGTQLAYIHGPELRVIAARGGAPRTVRRGPDAPDAPAWQPCVSVTLTCRSVTPVALPPAPVCQPSSVTTTAGTAIDLPASPCTDPSGRALTTILVKPPDHGTLSGRHYTPTDGFTGEDSILYKASNGASDSAVTKLSLFVVPRPTAPAAPPAAAVPVRRAPFLSAQAKPKLDGHGRTLLRASCDQPCTVKLRLTVRLRSRKTVEGPLVTKTGRTFSLRLRLRKAEHGVKTAWITGSVRNAGGDARAIKLPVTLPR